MNQPKVKQKSQILSVVLACISLPIAVTAWWIGRGALADELEAERQRNACLVGIESRADVADIDYAIGYGEYVLALGGAGRMPTSEAQALIEAALVQMERVREERADSAALCP